MSLLFWFIPFCLSAWGGYALQRAWSGKYEGDKIRQSLRFHIRGYYVHFHHWLCFSLVFIILLLLSVTHPIVLGILAGFIAQGLTYRDRFIFIYPEDKFHEIYDKWRPKRK